MENADLSQALEVAESSAKEARELLMNYFGQLSNVSSKAHAGLVSEADVESEKLITSRILKAFPTHRVLGEEASFLKGDNFEGIDPEIPLWVIDPLDGTTNYVHRFPIFCISIGVWYRGQVHAGVIDVPVLKDTYTTIRGQGAFKNGKPIRVSDRGLLSEALLATGFFPDNKPALLEQLSIFSRLVSEARGVRRPGAAAYDLCMVAEGIFDAFWEKNLKPWDTAAGCLLVEEAGGQVSTYLAEDFDIFESSMIASNKLLHPLIQGEIAQAIKASAQ